MSVSCYIDDMLNTFINNCICDLRSFTSKRDEALQMDTGYTSCTLNANMGLFGNSESSGSKSFNWRCSFATVANAVSKPVLIIGLCNVQVYIKMLFRVTC